MLGGIYAMKIDDLKIAKLKEKVKAA